jgi:hypothetical protein
MIVPTMGAADATPARTPRMYDDLAGWFHLLTAPEEYAEEASLMLGLLREEAVGPVETLLELGSGGGDTASHLREHVRLTLTDVAPRMLDMSSRLNPDCEHLLGDMRSLRLGRTFDTVLIHDAIDYMTTDDDLRAAFETAFVHLRPGGAALFAPDHVRETWHAATEHGGHDGEGRALRYLEWSWDPDPTDTTYAVDFAILMREGDDVVRAVHERHVLGLFPRSTWLDLLGATGFAARIVEDRWERDLFVCRRPA